MLLTEKQIDALVSDVEAAAKDKELVSQKIQPLLDAQNSQRNAALALLKVVKKGFLDPELALRVYEVIAAAHPDDEAFLIQIGEHFDRAVDIDFLNAPPPKTRFVARLIAKLQALVSTRQGLEGESEALDSLSSTARISGRSYDRIAELAYQRLIELEPFNSRHHYNLGLFFKTRGRFAEGMEANRVAREVSNEVIDSYEWNFGICATGAGAGAAALEVWKRMGQNIDMGRFGLPEGSYPSCKVRLAERPHAERSAESDDPGEEETIWIERLSPCHGIIRSVLYQDLGVDFGDVILFDGAPITYHSYDGKKIPVFPHLATLVRQNYRFFDFVGIQSDAGQISKLSEALEGDPVVYVHSEKLEFLCLDCWLDSTIDHAHTNKREFSIVRGRIAVHPDKNLFDFLGEIDNARSSHPDCRIFSPDLCIAAELVDRAKFERKRFEQLQRS